MRAASGPPRASALNCPSGISAQLEGRRFARVFDIYGATITPQVFGSMLTFIVGMPIWLKSRNVLSFLFTMTVVGGFFAASGLGLDHTDTSILFLGTVMALAAVIYYVYTNR